MSQELAISKDERNVLSMAADWVVDENGDFLRDGTVEISIFANGECVTPEFCHKTAGYLLSVFPAPTMTHIISAIEKIVIEERWTKDRLNYAVKQILKSKYPTFTVGQFLDIDKKITLGKSPDDLRRKSKYKLDISDIVMVKIQDDYSGERRAYAYKHDADEVMPNRIVGVWNATSGWWDFSPDNMINDSTLDARRDEFKNELYQYCDFKPKFNGSYPPSVVKAFFEKYGSRVPPGDKMLFETIYGFNLESRLDSFSKLTKK